MSTRDRWRKYTFLSNYLAATYALFHVFVFVSTALNIEFLHTCGTEFMALIPICTNSVRQISCIFPQRIFEVWVWLNVCPLKSLNFKEMIWFVVALFAHFLNKLAVQRSSLCVCVSTCTHFRSSKQAANLLLLLFVFLFFSQASSTKGTGRTSSSPSSPLWSPPSWVTGGAGVSHAPAVTAKPKVTSCWHQWRWRGASTGACTLAILTTSDESTHLAMSQVSWSSGKSKWTLP